MEKKRPYGIAFFTILFLLYPTRSLLTLTNMCLVHYKESSLAASFMDKLFGWLNYLAIGSQIKFFYFPLLLSLITIIIGFGFFQLKRWGYYSIITFSIFSLLTLLRPLLRITLYHLRGEQVFKLSSSNFFLGVIIPIVFFGGLIYYLTRLEVKEQFK